VETRFVDSRSGQIVMVTADREGLIKQSFDNMARDLVRFLVRVANGSVT